MISIYLGGEKISYTAGDTFVLSVASSDGFDERSSLKFCIAKNEESENVIEKEFLQENGQFNVELSADEAAKLTLGEYVYKLVLINGAGEISTEKSGELTVKWGA